MLSEDYMVILLISGRDFKKLRLDDSIDVQHISLLLWRKTEEQKCPSMHLSISNFLSEAGPRSAQLNPIHKLLST